jgi:hypothetical protein
MYDQGESAPQIDLADRPMPGRSATESPGRASVTAGHQPTADHQPGDPKARLRSPAGGARELLQLQRLAGNAAVQSLLGRSGSTDRPARLPTVQRCGGEVHEGCSCAQESEPDTEPIQRLFTGPVVQRCGGEVHEGCSCAYEEAAPTAKPTGVPEASRQVEGDEQSVQTDRAQTQQGQIARAGTQRVEESTPTVQRFVDGTPEAPSTDLPDGSPYASMDADLLGMLGRTLTAKSFWRWSGGKPTNLGAALDMLGAADINTLVQLKRRCDMHGLWRYITTMTGLWSTSSLGITFTGPGGLQGSVGGAEDFCRDTAVGESYHPGKSCWREIVPPDTPGLHVCLPNEIHIDPHQTVDGKGWSWSWGSGGPEFGTACTYSFLAFLSHMGDVEGNRPVNPFTHHGQIRSAINDRLPQLEERVKTHPDISATRDDIAALSAEMDTIAPILRRWSVQGKEGGEGDEEARRVLNQLDAADGRLARARDALRGSDDVPDPGIIYMP